MTLTKILKMAEEFIDKDQPERAQACIINAQEEWQGLQELIKNL